VHRSPRPLLSGQQGPLPPELAEPQPPTLVGCRSKLGQLEEQLRGLNHCNSTITTQKNMCGRQTRKESDFASGSNRDVQTSIIILSFCQLKLGSGTANNALQRKWKKRLEGRSGTMQQAQQLCSHGCASHISHLREMSHVETLSRLVSPHSKLGFWHQVASLFQCRL
jgi:hypothetical protein